MKSSSLYLPIVSQFDPPIDLSPPQDKRSSLRDYRIFCASLAQIKKVGRARNGVINTRFLYTLMHIKSRRTRVGFGLMTFECESHVCECPLLGAKILRSRGKAPVFFGSSGFERCSADCSLLTYRLGVVTPKFFSFFSNRAGDRIHVIASEVGRGDYEYPPGAGGFDYGKSVVRNCKRYYAVCGNWKLAFLFLGPLLMKNFWNSRYTWIQHELFYAEYTLVEALAITRRETYRNCIKLVETRAPIWLEILQKKT